MPVYVPKQLQCLTHSTPSVRTDSRQHLSCIYSLPRVPVMSSVGMNPGEPLQGLLYWWNEIPGPPRKWAILVLALFCPDDESSR